MLHDNPSRISLKLKPSRLSAMAQRQIAATQSLKDLPVSISLSEKYIMNEQAPKPLKTRIDTAKTPLNRATGLRESRDFVTYSRLGGGSIGARQVQSKVSIRPLTDMEKSGPKFSARRI